MRFLLPAQVFAAKAASLVPGAAACVLTPQIEEGPYYFDPKLQRSDIRDGHAGAPLRLLLQIVDAADCAPLSGVRVDVWHCDARGFYSGYEGQGDDQATSTVGQKFLRGVQITDGNGLVTFDTIYPGWYHGRTTHIHIKAFLGDGKVATSQLFFPDALSEFIYENISPYAERKAARDTINATDFDVRNGGDGRATFCSVKEEADRYLATLVVGIDRTAAVPDESDGPIASPPDGPPPPATRGRREDAHRRALDDGAELVGGAGQLQARLDELDARARVDGEHPFRLEHAQRVAERRHRNAEELHQLALRDESPGRNTPVEQRFEDAVIGEIAQATARRHLRQLAHSSPATCRASRDGLLDMHLIYQFSKLVDHRLQCASPSSASPASSSPATA